MSKFLCIPRVGKSISESEIKFRLRDVTALCSSRASNSSKLRTYRDKALDDLIEILRDSKREQLQRIGPREFVYCSIKILAYYEENYHSKSRNWRYKKNHRAKICHKEILSSFVPEKSKELVSAFVDVIESEALWRWEFLCWEISRDLLECNVQGFLLVDAFLDRVENEKTGFQDAQAIVRILYELLDSYSWPGGDETVLIIERLLKLFYNSLAGRADRVPPYAPLKRGLQVCLHHTIKNLRNEDLLVVIHRMCSWCVDDTTTNVSIFDFGSTLEYAAHVHETRLYRDTLTSNIFPILMKMISSTNRLVSLLGNRVMQHLLDRNDNRSNFDSPKIFFENMNFDVKVNPCDKEDKYFFQKNREILHDSLVDGVMNHCSTRLNLESIYCTVCLIAVEVPSGFTAAALVCLVMNLQDLTLEQREMSREVSSHIHAMIMAIMSLLCWIHEAKVFYTYVNKIMMQRAQWAPHLNPPIKSRYSFAIHHILWDKPDLFFLDWEARYGLWKCFRLREEQHKNTPDPSKKNR